MGVIKVGDVVRRTDPEERWNHDNFHNLVKHPIWRPNPQADDLDIHVQVRVPRDDTPITPITAAEPSDRAVHRFPLRAADARRRGLWADRCPGCRAIRDNATAQGHSEECRASIEKMLTDARDPRIVKTVTRMFTHFVNK